MKRQNYGFVFLLATVIPVFAHAYLPVFSGYWYTDSNFVNKDACYKNTYAYQNWGKGSGRAYAEKVLSQLADHPNCQWGPVSLIAKFSERPSDFVGSNVEWSTVSATGNAVVGERWQRQCVNDKKAVIDQSAINIWPHYACPKPSHYGRGAKTGNFACIDAPLVCSADIVGRDLADASTNKLFGHVGLVTTLSGQNRVLEVLPTPPAVYENTLDSFIKKSKFWGEKYGLKQAPILSFGQARDIVNTGSSQKGVALEYTWDWKWNPGDKTKPAVFRCDSFIYYAYLRGAKLKIFLTGFHFPDNPPSMFKKFLSFRLSQYPDMYDPPSLLEQAQYYAVMPEDNISYNARLAQVFSEKELDIEVADKLTYQYFYDPNISRSEKMQTLYGLAKQHQNDRIAFSYLVDILAGFEPIEYAQQLIEFYRQQASVEVKRDMLLTIAALMAKFYPEGKNAFAGNEYNVSLIREFFQELVKYEVNPELLNIAIYYYSNLGKPDQAKDEINAALRRAEKNHIQLNFSNSELILLKLKLAFYNENAQRHDLPELLSANVKGSDTMAFTLNSLVQELPPESISDEVRPLLQSYLLKHQDLLLGQKVFYKTYRPDQFLCDWLSAYATVMVKHESDKIPFMVHYIRTLPSPIEQARLLEQQNWQVLDKILSADRRYYRETFQKALKDPGLSDDDRQRFEYALSAINR